MQAQPRRQVRLHDKRRRVAPKPADPVHNVRGVHSRAMRGMLVPFGGEDHEVTAVSGDATQRSPRSELVFTLPPGRGKGEVGAMRACWHGGNTARMACVSLLFLYYSSIVSLLFL